MWEDLDNARAYDAFGRAYAYYSAAARALLQASAPSGAERIIDLACGTGISTEVIQAALPQAQLWGIDAAPAMLEVARAKTWSTTVTFCQGSTPADAQIAPATVDLILCNSAMWLFPLRPETFAALAQALVPGGRLAFNLPAELIGEVAHLMSPAGLAFWQGLQAVREELGLPLPQASAPTAEPPCRDLSAWGDLLQAGGFARVRCSRWPYPISAGEYLAHCQIPAILASYLPKVSAKTRAHALGLWFQKIDPQALMERCWVMVVAERG